MKKKRFVNYRHSVSFPVHRDIRTVKKPLLLTGGTIAKHHILCYKIYSIFTGIYGGTQSYLLLFLVLTENVPGPLGRGSGCVLPGLYFQCMS